MRTYKGYEIEPAAYFRAPGGPFTPCAILIACNGSRKPKRLSWPDRACASGPEAERVAVECARRVIDLGEVR
jgi:hypothetical protein